MDRVGLGWRPELSAAILSHLEVIDVVEVILDDCFKASRLKLQALRTLSRQVPVFYHGVGLGLASAVPLQQFRIDRIAKTLDGLGAEEWSEHLAFVRAGEIEIGHLAAAPRNQQTLDGAISNLELIRRTVGRTPVLENIATLIDPPHSTLSEGQWVSGILSNSGAGFLLDLHNLYANAVNFGIDPFAYLKTFPLELVEQVHLSGGHWIAEPIEFRGRGQRLLDDHIHGVPDVVFQLLKSLAGLVLQPLTVIIERDGNYPSFTVLLREIDRARECLRLGRARTKTLEEGHYECASV